MQLAKLVSNMNTFAANTKNDNLSVAVARVAARLNRQHELKEKPLTVNELKIVRAFLKAA